MVGEEGNAVVGVGTLVGKLKRWLGGTVGSPGKVGIVRARVAVKRGR